MNAMLNAAVLGLLAAAALLLAPLHTGWEWPRPGGGRLLPAAGAVALWLLLCRSKLGRGDARCTPGVLPVIFASQTGGAERLAGLSVEMLRAAGRPARALDLRGIEPARLAGCAQALFVVSTTGEGDAPDTARAFIRQFQRRTPALAGLRFGLLALGDRRYARFCGFGRELERRLGNAGATRLFPTIEVDNGDPAALARWRAALGSLCPDAPLPVIEAAPFTAARLRACRLLNAGSLGEPMFEISLELPEPLDWAAGDIVEIRVPGPPGGRLREYSVASIPEDGCVQLVVRRLPGGAGSVWLTERCAPGATVELRLRRNPAFHAPPEAAPMLLIGNGSGMAGLRAHLRAQAARGRGGHWLVYGERQRAHDALYREEIEAWLRNRTLTRADLVYSRAAPQREYVQDRLRREAEALREFVAEGAWIYVCGSLGGMAPGVDAALHEVLGSVETERLMAAGRYRRDVY